MQPGMMAIHHERDWPLILGECQSRAMVGMRLFVAGVWLAVLDCLHSRLEHTFCFAEVVKKSSKSSMFLSIKQASEISGLIRHANQVSRQTLFRVCQQHLC